MLLLDTHALLWAIAEPGRLGRRARSRIGQAAQVYVSSISLAEITIKSMLGRLRVPDDLPVRLTEQRLRPLPFTGDHARAIGQFGDLVRHDPFDRMLVAQAAEEGLTLLTADRRLVDLRRDWIVDARM